MPPKASISANTGSVSAPETPLIIAVADTVDRYPEAPESSGDVLMSSNTLSSDIPGPSTTFIPRQPSPPLPDLSKSASGFDTYDSDSESSEPDEIAYTLPIYLSSTLTPNLNLFQYPLQHRSLKAPTWAEDRGKKITTRVKENVGRVEVEIPVDGGAEYWREDRARELGFVNDVKELNGDGEIVGGVGINGAEGSRGGKEKKTKVKKKEQKWGDKVRLRSEILPNVTGYYAGIVHEGALHLHPINRTLQFRTSLTYLDEYDVKLRTQASITRSNPNGDDNDEENSRPKPPATQPSMASRSMPLRKEDENDGSGSIKDFRNKMWTTAQREEEDKWVAYEWKEGVDDSNVEDSLERLLVVEEKRRWLKCQTRPLDYLDKA